MNLLKTEDIITAIDVCKNILIDAGKDVEYLETKKDENELTDSEYQDLHYARECINAFKISLNYLETIK